MLVGGCEYHLRRIADRPQELHTCNMRHLYIQEQQVDRLLLQHIAQLQRILANTLQVEKTNFFDIALQSLSRKGFVIGNDTTYLIAHIAPSILL